MKSYSLFLGFVIGIVKEISASLSGLKFFDGVLFAIAVWLCIWLFIHQRKYCVSSININIPFSLGNITLIPTNQDRIVAWKLYVQLRTRKAALLFDEKNDVIAEVYASLYQIFPLARDLLMGLSLNEIEKTPGIADLVFRVQNDGVRPHLTKWQADFLKWWDEAKKEPANKNRSPQSIQKDYPKYTELVTELIKMNIELNKFTDELLLIAKTSGYKKKMTSRRTEKISPVQPTQTGT